MDMDKERLDKIIAERTSYSRKDVKALVRAGRVLLNGSIPVSSDVKAGEADVLLLDGKPLMLQKHIYIMMNKPEGVLSATRDKKQPTVLSLVPPALYRQGLFPAGRLDKDTRGFLLLTDDGAFAHRILSPKNHVPKTYRARLDSKVDIVYLKEEFARGMELGGGDTASPAFLSMIEDGENPLVELTIYEGAFHQVKRMFGRYLLTVLELERISIGKLALDKNLPYGECRQISTEELALIC